MKIKRLKLEAVDNVRDLGGYPISANAITKWGLFLRSADLEGITKNDIDLLLNYGIKTVIDLKMFDETSNPIKNDKRFNYTQVPLFDDFNDVLDISKNYNNSVYLTIIKVFKPRIKEVFNFIGNHINNGGILFHCLVGKDRTGIIAVLLLLLAGVSDIDILADYIVSAIYIRPIMIKQNKSYEEIRIYPEEIELIMAEINDNYNGAENYLRDIGVSAEAINNIKLNFIYEG